MARNPLRAASPEALAMPSGPAGRLGEMLAWRPLQDLEVCG